MSPRFSGTLSTGTTSATPVVNEYVALARAVSSIVTSK